MEQIVEAADRVEEKGLLVQDVPTDLGSCVILLDDYIHVFDIGNLNAKKFKKIKQIQQTRVEKINPRKIEKLAKIIPRQTT